MNHFLIFLKLNVDLCKLNAVLQESLSSPSRTFKNNIVANFKLASTIYTIYNFKVYNNLFLKIIEYTSIHLMFDDLFIYYLLHF